MSFNEFDVVEKPWGREIRFAHEPEYIGKIIEVKEGHKLSLQYHEEKKETMYVLSGRMLLTLGDEQHEVGEGESITFNPQIVHRVEALSDLRIIEVSTSHMDDVIRLEDDYKRI
ncbi:MAG: cupin domain-containing protein [Candidatus Altiarchaeales archaeon]|nr:cupin domain-containing protein [Candidatus Altiarchaeales archaeon]